MVLPKSGPVAEPPVTVLVEHINNLSSDQLKVLAVEIEKALHHQLRFRASIQLQNQDTFEIQTGTTGKSKLVEVLNP